MELRITTLIENEPDDKNELLNEHGLSLYVEFDGKKFVFDTGQTGKFLSNAEKINIKIDALDYVIISHGHYDHSGGVKSLFNIVNRSAKMYVGKEFFHFKYKKLNNGTYKYNGNSFKEEDVIRLGMSITKIDDDVTYLTEKIIIFKNFKRRTEFEYINKNLVKKVDGEYSIDEFNDELALGLITSKGLVVLVGCSHVGIINILNTILEKVKVPLHSVIGGTHLVGAEKNRIDKTIETFKAMKLKEIAISHCTGEQGKELLKNEFKSKFINNNTGNVYML